MIGIDFVGPISPISKGGRKYILIAVDYFSRFLFASAVENANGEVVKNFVHRKIARVMGWPRAVYCDNASYFVKGVFADELRKRRVLQFTAPITHPSSVGLAEKYVHLLMTGLRTILHGPGAGERSMAIELWDTCVDAVVFAINNRFVRTHGFTPAQLMFGFTPRGHAEDFTIRDEYLAYSGELESRMVEWAKERVLEEWEVGAEGNEAKKENKDEIWSQLSNLEEVRREALGNMIDVQLQAEDRDRKMRFGGTELELGDLVLLRRFAVDKDKGRRLETKWEGPYRMSKWGKPGASIWIRDMHTDRVKGRYSLDSVKIYVQRQSIPAEEANFVDVRGIRVDRGKDRFSLME